MIGKLKNYTKRKKKKELEDDQKYINTTEGTICSTKTELASTKTELASTKTELASIKTELASIKAELEFKQKLASKEKSLEQQIQKSTTLEAQNNRLKLEHLKNENQMQDQIDKLKQKVAANDEKLNSIKKQLTINKEKLSK